MKITAAASYAVTAVTHIANAPSGQLVANSEISRVHKLPERFLLQVLRHLVNGGVLTSVRGVYGGYKLARSASKITLLEIIESVDGPLTFGLDGSLPLAPKASAAVHGAFDALEADARKRLGAITLADLRSAKAA